MTKDEVLKLALEALEHCCFSDALVTDRDVAADAILAIKKALAQPEPLTELDFGWTDCAETDEGAIALHQAPQQRAWVGLTHDEVKHEWEVWRASVPRYSGFAKGIEAKLKEKNT